MTKELKTKPFNLAEALAGKPCMTRMGEKVTEIHQFSTDIDKKLLVRLVPHYPATENYYWYFPHGKMNVNPNGEYNDDLVMIEEPSSNDNN